LKILTGQIAEKESLVNSPETISPLTISTDLRLGQELVTQRHRYASRFFD
jgi:hypothetical protein